VVIHDLVVEDGEVEGEPESDWVASVEGLGGGVGEVVVLEGAVLDGVELLVGGALGYVSVVVADHLVEEGLGLVGAALGHALGLDGLDNSDALLVELSLDLLFVGGEPVVEFLVLWILLDGADGSNGSSLGADLVLESNGKQVSLLSGEVFVLGLDDLLEIGHHIVESFSLFGNSGHENVLF